MPLCGVYRRLACKFSKVGREELGDVTEEAKTESATDESNTDTDAMQDVCKKCYVRPSDPLIANETGICNECRNKRSAMSKWFGQWPIEMFEELGEEQQKAFWLGE